MKKFKVAALAAALAAVIAVPAQAAVTITEVAPWSNDSVVGQDWFELTNTGASAIDITGWKMDDDSAKFSKAVLLQGVTSIAAGQSVVFIENTATNGNSLLDAAGTANLNAAFISTWFGGTAPAGLTIGNYGGSGVGLSASKGDQVNIYDAGGNLQANVSFGASTTNVTFDNAAGLNNATISQLSVIGTNGAFAAVGDSNEIGSPGTIAAVPEPETYAMLLAGLGLLGIAGRRRGK